MGDQDGGHVQCDHSKGKGNPVAHPEMDDALMQKEEWSLDDWVEMYEKVPFNKNQGGPSKELVKYIKALLPSEPARVFVPLCGKSPDMRWLYERGNTVVGVEGVEMPVKEFFESHSDLKHTVEDVSFGKVYKVGNSFRCWTICRERDGDRQSINTKYPTINPNIHQYPSHHFTILLLPQSHDERLQVYVCDFTQIPKGSLGHFDAGFDWGAYTAIRPADRPKYVEVVKDAMGENFRYFLEVCHDGPPDALGLPHSISFRTLKLDFGIKSINQSSGVSLNVWVLATKDISAEWEVDTFFNSFLLLSDKDF
ncbi:Thiopurine S-methyltransferase [Chionoecetes opilio]|uniref:Thiopurine S-methyltransferase n=1 Tax=Chionoecetes opilio TaxID=41210 RepID=A0A8J4XQ50_CHIOP|nr:Thiopurine S-methyltransferase [Chionoecetes opilio]